MLIRLEKKTDISRAAKRLLDISKSDLNETAYKYIGYPPDLADDAVQGVLAQAELLLKEL